MVEEEPRHGVGKSFVEGEVNVEVPKPGNEVLPVGVDLLRGRCLWCSVAVDDIDDAAVFDEHSLIATNRVHSVNDRDVADRQVDGFGGVLCAASYERGAE